MSGFRVLNQLIRAQLEILTADPSAALVARVFFNSTTGRAGLDNGSQVRAFLLNDDKLVIGNNGTANNNIRLNRSAASVLQLLLGGAATAEGSAAAYTSWAALQSKLSGCLVSDDLLFTQQSGTPTAPASGQNAIYFKDDGRFYSLDSSGTETQIGSGSSSGVNYISNPDFETNSTGWRTYANAAATSPVDEFGGSPNITFARSTSSPLRGAASGLLTKDAANRQGQGISYDFTIATADKAKPLTISFEYNVSANFTAGTGASSLSDVVVYIYDTFNNTLIQPAPFVLTANSTATAKFSATFQSASNSTTYRLILHIAGTGTTAWTMQLDSVVVSPQVLLYGSPISDWTSYTPTTGLTGGTLAVTGYWRRVGDSMEVLANITNTAVFTGGTATISLPSGYSIDTAKIPGTAAGNAQILGTCNLIDTGTDTYPALVYYNNTTSVVLRCMVDDSGTSSLYVSGGGTISTTVPFTWANGDIITARFSVPISGWGSNVIMSQDASTRAVALSVALTTVTTGIASQVVKFNSITNDTHGGYNATTGLYTVPVAGWYLVSTSILFSDVSSATDCSINIQKNGATVKQIYAGTIGSGAAGQHSDGSHLVFCNAGDTLGVYATGDASFTLDSNGTRTVMSIARQAGPAAIAASETVYAKYTSSATPSFATTNIVDYATKELDSHGAVTTGASWKFTAPMSGVYEVKARWMTNAFASGGTSRIIGLILYKNGSAVDKIAVTAELTADSVQKSMAGSTLIRLNAGDYIDFRGTGTASTSTLSGTATENYVCITRVGN